MHPQVAPKGLLSSQVDAMQAALQPPSLDFSWAVRLYNQLAVIPKDLLLTLALAATLLVVANAASWVVSRKQSLEVQRFWRVTFRNIAAIGFLLGMGLIWRAQLQAFLVALGAATAGVLLVFREAFLSLLAFWVHVVKRPYSLGDFIEIDGVRGEVLDITWQHTVLAETGPGQGTLTYSGRVIQIPNNRMLLAPLFVDNLTGEYGAHVMQVHLPKGADILKAERLLMEAAEKHCSPYYAEARLHMDALRKTRAIDTPTVEPKSRIRISDDSTGAVSLRIVAPFREKLKVEQAILHDFLAIADEDAWPRKALLKHSEAV